MKAVNSQTETKSKVKLTRYNYHQFRDRLFGKRILPPKREPNFRLTAKNSANSSTTMAPSISEAQFRNTRVCRRLDDDFDKMMNNIQKGLSKEICTPRTQGAVHVPDILDEKLGKHHRTAHGATLTNIFEDRALYKRNALADADRSKFVEKKDNIPQHCVPSDSSPFYSSTLDSYHQLYLECMKHKKIPLLTEYIKKHRVTPKKNHKEDFNIYVKYNPESKRR